MQIAITSAGVGILLFLCAFLGFKQGLRLGMQAARGQIPPKLNPMSVVTEAKQPDPQDELLKGYANMMAYNGELPEEKR
jgi:hypothetical protein